ncbi:MAG: methyltransferase domain-containing protein, partial [Thermoplasmata archaeon]
MARGTRAPRVPYRLSADVYDRVYAWKDYAAEAVRIRQLVRRYGPTDAHALLDVACGTGEHLRFLGRWYRVTGLDSSSAMLSFA